MIPSQDGIIFLLAEVLRREPSAEGEKSIACFPQLALLSKGSKRLCRQNGQRSRRRRSAAVENRTAQVKFQIYKDRRSGTQCRVAHLPQARLVGVRRGRFRKRPPDCAPHSLPDKGLHLLSDTSDQKTRLSFAQRPQSLQFLSLRRDGEIPRWHFESFQPQHEPPHLMFGESQ